MILTTMRLCCSHCGSYIADLGLDDVVECGICDFMHPAMTLPDAMISKAIRLGESVERVEVVLNYF